LVVVEVVVEVVVVSVAVVVPALLMAHVPLAQAHGGEAVATQVQTPRALAQLHGILEREQLLLRLLAFKRLLKLIQMKFITRSPE
jgi:hypothetical protein